MPVKISALPSLGTMTDSAIIPVVASSTTSQISGANLKTYFSSVTGNITGGNINTGGVVSATGNITGGNINVAGMSLSGNVVSAINTTANITTTANISGSYVLGNGSQLTGMMGPIFAAYNTTNQSLSTGTANLVYSTASVNTNTYYNTTTGIYTPLVAGWYQVNTSMLVELTAGVADAAFYIGLYKNGTLDGVGTITVTNASWGTIGPSTVNKLVYLNGSTDTINCKLTSTINTGTWRTGISPINYFQATWVHA